MKVQVYFIPSQSALKELSDPRGLGEFCTLSSITIIPKIPATTRLDEITQGCMSQAGLCIDSSMGVSAESKADVD